MADRPTTDPSSGGTHPIEISILGELEVRCSGASVDLKGRRIRRLLVNLILDVGRPVSTDVLVDRLWGESPPASARKSVQKAVWELRKALGSDVDGMLTTGDHGYALRIDRDLVDAHRFESLVSEAFATSTRAAIAKLEAADLIWRGPALEGFADLEEAQPLAARLEELRVVAAERRLGLLLEDGRHVEALPEIERLASEHPLREELWAHLMTARAIAGRRNDALAAFQELRHRLAEELGIEPSSRLRDLERQVLDGDLTGAGPEDVASGPTPDTGAAPSTRLPHWLSSFVGRADLLETLDERLGDARLVTLTGVGGSGKTRLAAEAARRRTERGTGESRFIDLAAVEIPDLVVSATTAALGLADGSGADLSMLVLEMMGGRDALLIFDNCEHVLEVTASMVGDLLRDCPDLTILTTSREPLGIAGEHVLPVPPLAVPRAGSSVSQATTADAVELFVARAREADPTFEIDEHNVASVIEVCARLDGVPLALELAAAQIPAMAPADMADRLDDGLRMSGPVSGRPARQATLRATIDWSHGLLEGREQRAFERISVFPASFDLAAAEVVMGDEAVADLMGGLVRSSMVMRADRGMERTRYRLLDTLRTYGREILAEQGDLDGCRLEHARYFAGFVERLGDPKPSDGDRWHEVIDAEYPNLLSALEYSADRQPALAVRLVYALSAYWTRAPDLVLDGLRYVAPLVDRTDLDPSEMAKALCTAAELRSESGEAQQALEEAGGALTIFEETGETAGATRARFAKGRALVNGGDLEAGAELIELTADQFAASGSVRWAACTINLGFARRTRGDYAGAEQAFAQTLAWARRHHLDYTAAKAEWLLGSVAHHRGSLDQARDHCERALIAFDEIGDPPGVAHVRMTLGDIHRLTGDDPRARDLYASAHETLSEIGDLRCIASAVKNLGDLERPDDPRRASELYLECLERRHKLGDRSGVAEAFEGLAASLVSLSRLRSAAVLLGQAEALRAETGAVVLRTDEVDVATTRRTIATSLPADEVESAMAAGSELGVEEALACARSAVENLGATSADL